MIIILIISCSDFPSAFPQFSKTVSKLAENLFSKARFNLRIIYLTGYPHSPLPLSITVTSSVPLPFSSFHCRPKVGNAI